MTVFSALRRALSNAATAVLASILVVAALAKGWTTGQKPK